MRHTVMTNLVFLARGGMVMLVSDESCEPQEPSLRCVQPPHGFAPTLHRNLTRNSRSVESPEYVYSRYNGGVLALKLQPPASSKEHRHYQATINATSRGLDHSKYHSTGTCLDWT